MVDDLCLTLKIHPYSLLLDVEQTGRMSVGEDVKLSLYVIHNLARASETFNSAGRRLAGTEAVHADKECCNRLSLSSETPHVIPSKVYGIAKYSTSSIKAVLVVEHRNVGVQSNWFRANMKNVLMVMVSTSILSRLVKFLDTDGFQTGGYPSIATREFLCLLWSYFTSTVVRVPPFYFCSDHDPWAFHIFFLLKYGARKTAAMSTSLVCPTLEWVGPTREDVLQEAENYYTSDWPNENRLRSNADAKNEHADAKIELAKCKAKLIARMSKEPTAEAKNLIKALGTRGYTELEPTVAEEMQAILDGKAVRRYMWRAGLD